MSLNMPENARTKCSDYARFLNMLSYRYNNIINIVTNAIVFEFLSARFTHPVALLPIYLFKHDLEYKNNES